MSRLQRGDALVAALLVFFLLLGLGIRDAVGDLGQMGREIGEAGAALRDSGRATAGDIRSAFGSAADASGSVPVLGGGLGDALRDVGESTAAALERQAVATGEDLARSGRQGQDDAERLADLLGLLAFVAPSALLLALTLPQRRRAAASGAATAAE